MEKTTYIQQRVQELEHHNESDEIAGYLCVAQGGDLNREERIPLHYGANLVGGTIGNSILLKGRGVSTFHAIIQIEHDPHLAFIEDLQSTNGTSISIPYHKGEFRLIPKRLYQITHNQEVVFGPSRCIFQSANSTEHSANPNCQYPEPNETLESIESKTKSPPTKKTDSKKDHHESEDEQLLPLHIDTEDSIRELPFTKNAVDAIDAAHEINVNALNIARNESKEAVLDIPPPPLIPVKRSKRQNTTKSKIAKIEKNCQEKSAFLDAGFKKAIKKPIVPSFGPSKKKPSLSLKKAASLSQKQSQNDQALLAEHVVNEDENTETVPPAASNKESLTDDDPHSVEPKVENEANESIQSIQSKSNTKGRNKKPALAKGKENKKANVIVPLVSKAGSTIDMKSSSTSRSRRSKTESKAVRVLISVDDKSSLNIWKKNIKRLGGESVENVADCTHLVCDKVKRTIKFLGCVSNGKFIVSPLWLEESFQTNSFADPWQFLVSDEEGEEKFGFGLKESLEKTKSGDSVPKLLEGYTVYATISVVPKEDDLKVIVADAGGLLVIDPPEKNHSKYLVIGHENDSPECSKLQSLGFNIYHVDLILNGILRQSLDLKDKSLRLSF